MRWCLRVKLAQNWEKFSELLLDTGDRPIVEESRKDNFWGAKPTDEFTLVGMNVLGRLLMELRETIKAEKSERLFRVEPLAIPEFKLNGRVIGTITGHNVEKPVYRKLKAERSKPTKANLRKPVHASLFDDLE